MKAPDKKDYNTAEEYADAIREYLRWLAREKREAERELKEKYLRSG